MFDFHTGRHDEDVKNEGVAALVQQFPQHSLIKPRVGRMLKSVRVLERRPREVEDDTPRPPEALLGQRIRVAHNSQQVLALLDQGAALLDGKDAVAPRHVRNDSRIAPRHLVLPLLLERYYFH